MIRRVDGLELKPSTRVGRTRAAREREEIKKAILAGADSLFAQLKYVDMYTSKRGSNITEANIVIHVAHSFLKEPGHSVWAQSPFGRESPSKSNWLDLVIDLNTAVSGERTVVLLEAKRIVPGERAAKIREISQDWRRIQAWPNLAPASVPIGVSLDPVRKAYGAIVVIVSAGPNSGHSRGKAVSPTFCEWWKDLGEPPRNQSRRRFERLASKLKNALRGSKPCPHSDGGRKIAVLYAVFDTK